MNSSPVQFSMQEGVARVELAHSADGNALTPELVADLKSAIERAQLDKSCRVLVLSGAGNEFCRGGSFKALLEPGSEGTRVAIEAIADVLLALCRSALPTLALVQGRTQGGGVGLAAACDLVLADSDAEFLLPEALAGLLPAVITPVLLRRMSPARVRALALSTRAVHAREAQVFGLVDEVAEHGLAKAGRIQVKRLLRSSPAALAESKRFFEETSFNDLEEALNEGVQRAVAWLDREDTKQGLQASLSGDLPPWWPSPRKRVSKVDAVGSVAATQAGRMS